ncbi:MAG: RNA-directed DNA polymerase [Bacteroidetes bacterium]|nr:RNA-directed DNA polymerase [Bacteroidota bacterium]
MKRAGNLIPQISCFDNLYLAYFKAKKGKEHQPTVVEYSKNLDENLTILQRQIITGNVSVGNYHYFTIYDPKERQICAADFNERVLHHALMNVCHPCFEKYQIFDSYATRIGKGTYKALERAKRFQKEYQWYFKFDVRKYFDSISHCILQKMLERKFKDEVLLGIFDRIINSYHTKTGQGVPIGNLTSQYFANHYLGLLDHYVTSQLHSPAYIRYTDDFIIWHNNKDILKETGKKITIFLEEQLGLCLKTADLNRCSKGLTFVGYLIFPEKTHLAARSRKRYQHKMKEFTGLLETGIWSQSEFQHHALALNAFVFHADSLYFRKKVLCNIGQ